MWQPQLTDHELASLRLLARGHTHTQIAVILRVSPKTAGQLLFGARLSLRARTLPHAVAIGYETGVLERNRDNV
ncbi:LuxR C-terminal-related transcriptional regulator [Streptomyces sp. NPDC005538]|uniref:LuxR C-terminal-related transcriptional regulator n=1 Tax=Streptomyces sp. NPDC005538 TaxID=3157043 RepID=UPI0033ADEB7E